MSEGQALIIEIIVIALTILFFAGLVASYIYKKKHNIPTGECANCATKKNNLLKEYYKKYPKDDKKI